MIRRKSVAETKMNPPKTQRGAMEGAGGREATKIRNKKKQD